MGTIKITKAESELVRSVEHGEKIEFKGTKPRISAEVLRHIALGLPLFSKGTGAFSSDVPCTVTGAGVSIRNATISGRLILDSAIGCDGGPLCAFEFRDCTFRGGFSGAHAHFSRLGFRNCVFVDRGNARRPRPTVDLSGAKLDRQLDMQGVRPDTDVGHLWIRAPGIQVGGSLELSRCGLRAPAAVAVPRGPHRREDALDLNSALIEGDLFVESGIVEGRFAMRGGRIRGDIRLQGARFENPVQEHAVLLQATQIGGFAMLRQDTGGRRFHCDGKLILTACEICRSLVVMNAEVTGGIEAPDLIVKDDLFLHATVAGDVDFEHMTVGGSLDIAGLRIAAPEMRTASLPVSAPIVGEAAVVKKRTLSLKDGRIGRELRLVPEERHRPASFEFDGIVDLTGLSCETLDDADGLEWGRQAEIRMDHFTYSRTGSPSERGRKPSHVRLWHWLLARWAEGHWPLRWLWKPRRLQNDDYWESWELRRNWIYQQFDTGGRDPVSLARHKISERNYHPQPFGQAIRVARGEGRDDFATRFEMLKQRIEWDYFTRLVRWWLGFAGIGLGTLWLVLHQKRVGGHFDWELLGWTMIALGTSLALMVRTTDVHMVVRSAVPAIALGVSRLRGENGAAPDKPKLKPAEPRKVHRYWTWFIYFLPVLGLLLLSDWKQHPFHFVIGFLIFVSVRFIAAFAHVVMRLGFGYLRRPVRAIVTLILAFVIGWWGVAVASKRNMLVVDAEPVAGVAAADEPKSIERPQDGNWVSMGSRGVPADSAFVRDVSCVPTVSEALYALDVLIPLIDLREESRCEVRRSAERGREWPKAADMSLTELVDAIPAMTIDYHRFWWLMKALYAIAGWFIVSLALLTFTHANRTRGDPS